MNDMDQTTLDSSGKGVHPYLKRPLYGMLCFSGAMIVFLTGLAIWFKTGSDPDLSWTQVSAQIFTFPMLSWAAAAGILLLACLMYEHRISTMKTEIERLRAATTSFEARFWAKSISKFIPPLVAASEISNIELFFNQPTSFANKMNRLLFLAMDAVKCQGASILTRTDSGLAYAFVQNDGIIGEEALLLNTRLPIDATTIAGKCAKTSEMVHIPDVSKSEFKVSQIVDTVYKYKTVSILSFPLSSKAGDVIGVFQLVNAINDKWTVSHFTKSQIHIAETLSKVAENQMQNADLTCLLRTTA